MESKGLNEPLSILHLFNKWSSVNRYFVTFCNVKRAAKEEAAERIHCIHAVVQRPEGKGRGTEPWDRYVNND